MSRLAGGEREASLFINMARSAQHAVRPECDLCISNGARKAHAFVDELRAQTQSASLRIDQKQPDACDAGLIILHQQDTADVFAVQLGDPSSLALCVEVVDEIGDDLRAEAFERLAPTVFPQVELGVA